MRSTAEASAATCPRTEADHPVAPSPPPARRWWILAVLALAQLMVVLDATIVNIALPRAQADLGFSDESRQWVVSAYALSFGALLLVGGRLGDVFGRKAAFMAGLVGFAVASAVGGAAGSIGVLIAARAGQGVFGALLAPAALSLLTTTFTDPAERGRAFGIFGAIAGGGGAIGLLLGGALTEWASWQWCLYVNLVIAVPVLLLGAKFLVGGRPQGGQIDVPGAIAVTAALFALVYGFSKAETDGWGATSTIGFLAAGAVLLVVFVAIELRTAHPLLPMRVIADRDRGGSYLAMAVSGAGMFAVFLFLTFYLQTTLGYSPMRTGVAFLPMIAGVVVGAQVSGALLPRVGPRPLVPAGMAAAAAGMVLFTRLDLDSGYATGIQPGLVVAGIGMGFIVAPGMQTATTGVQSHDAGVASATVNTVQQVGGSIGTAVFSTVASSGATGWVAEHSASAAGLGPLAVQANAALAGYVDVFACAAGLFAVGAVLTGLLLRNGVQERDPGAGPVLAH